MSYYLGIDLGTTSVKTIVVDDRGAVVFTTSPSYPFATPRQGWAESDPADWCRAGMEALREVTQRFDPAEIAGIGLTGQMHGLVLLDAEGEVLRPAIMWNDQRTAAECRKLTERVGAEEVLRITGNPILTGFTAPKIAWVQKHEPEVWKRVAKMLLPKDYLRYCLSGEFFSEVSDASGTSLLDVGRRAWSETMLEACGVRRSQLPELTESPVVSAQVSEEGAKESGLLAGTPIVAGGGDQAAGAIGCGIVRPGLMSCTLGTSGVLFAHAEKFEAEPKGRLHAFCAAVPGKWHYMGVQLSSAGSYQWFHDSLAPESSFSDLDRLAAESPAGSEGLLFLPYLSGERTPHPDPDARGAFVGLSLRHGRGHLARAVLEGVAYGLRDALELMRELGLKADEVVVAGGGAKSPLWQSIIADTFETPLVTVNAAEGAAFGAAMLAMVGTGRHPSVEAACDAIIRPTGRIDPSDAVPVYNAFYERYRELYPALSGSFARIARTAEQFVG